MYGGVLFLTNVTLDQCRISKGGVTSAFPKLDYSPLSTMLLVISIISGWVLIHLVGNFVWTGFPLVFGVLGRGRLRIQRPRLQGLVFLCCDDFINFSLAATAINDKFLVQPITNFVISKWSINGKKLPSCSGWGGPYRLGIFSFSRQ